MLNQMHNLHRRNTHRRWWLVLGQAMGEELGVCRCAGETCMYVKDVSNNSGYECEAKKYDALKHNISHRSKSK